VESRVEYPKELLAFWNREGIVVQATPPHNPGCTFVSTGEGPDIMSPSDRMLYYLVSSRQRLPLQAGSGVDVREHRWYLDERYLGRGRPGEKLFVALPEGHHRVSCMDDRGRISSVRVEVRFVGGAD
jgi:penicillin-binding protein 1C